MALKVTRRAFAQQEVSQSFERACVRNVYLPGSDIHRRGEFSRHEETSMGRQQNMIMLFIVIDLRSNTFMLTIYPNSIHLKS
jgi:hypothetical protein